MIPMRQKETFCSLQNRKTALFVTFIVFRQFSGLAIFGYRFLPILAAFD